MRIGPDAFETLFETAEIPMGLVDGAGVLARLNPAWQRVLGWAPETIIGRAWTDLVEHDSRSAAEAAAAALGRGETVRRCVMRCRAGDASTRLLEWTMVPASGRISIMVREVEETSDMVFEKAFAAAPVGLALVDLSTDRIVDANPAFCAPLGHACAGMKDFPFDDLVPAEFRVPRALTRAALSATGSMPVLEAALLCADGQQIPALLRGTRLDEGLALYAAENLTERRRLEAALREERDFLGAIVDTSVSAILVVSEGGTVEFANAAAEALVGPSGAALGPPLPPAAGFGRFTLEDEPTEAAGGPVQRVLETGQPVQDVRFVVRSKTGERRVLSVNAAPLRAAGEATRVIVAVSDVTVQTDHQLALEEQVRERTAELERALARQQQINQFQRRFVSVVSHEFRTPLAIIDASAHRTGRVLARGEPERAEEYLAKIGGAVQRLTGILESVLETAKMQEGEVELDPQPFSLAAVLRECVGLQADLSPHMTLRTEVSDDAGVVADRRLVQQIVTNMLSNAVKYSGTETEVIARLSATEDSAVLSVQDFGVGVAADEMDNIFRPFFRASTAEGVAGTGLGLSLSKTLARMHGGDLRFESRVGEGSTITLTLPRRLEAAGNGS